ncbi:MFS general substrate transporter [Paraphaeosphaeria sporulosa]|uniref:MFS general substrate transporter n=1 Tax=Paraphaeosphaeria sporulosa TaxID=1460663 RepID=A0A177CJT5_9PLEO|nr:MFS general substrate transporter [Paraphaeosphaeria sporulosa]OAG07511.1 MFS general substrate transporter [Paraphaeosphaeria sporulosa]
MDPSKQTEVAASQATPEVIQVDAEQEALAKRVLRKIDWRLIPLMFITYNLNFMDKTILSSASVFGLREDTGLVGQQYSWVSSIFYFGYFFWEYPTSYLIPRLPVAKYMAVNTFIWGAVVAVTAACTSYGGLITVRFLLGVAEATITPAFMFITSTWYTRDEIPTRTGYWFAGNSIGGLIASFLAFGIGHITDSLAPWQWMYIVLGVLTFVWGIPLLLFLPDSIEKASFLTEEERKFAADRVVISGTGHTANAGYKLDQVIECLIDPKTWLIFSMSLLTQIPNGGTQNFGNIVLKSFGFTSLQSTLLVIPASVISAGTIAGTGWIAGRFRQLNCLLIICVVIPAVVGSSLIYVRPRTSPGVQLFGYFLMSTGPGGIPLLMSLVGANYKGVTKKMTMTALLFIAYCAGNIAGPQFFRTKDAPHYNLAFRAILVCYCLVVGLAIVLRCYLQWMNAKREREEGVKGSAGAGGVVAGGKMADEDDRGAAAAAQIELRAEDYDDVTDWKTFGFRYRL